MTIMRFNWKDEGEEKQKLTASFPFVTEMSWDTFALRWESFRTVQFQLR